MFRVWASMTSSLLGDATVPHMVVSQNRAHIDPNILHSLLLEPPQKVPLPGEHLDI